MSYRIGICEDEKVFQDSLIKLINTIAQEQGLQLKIQTFSTLERLKSFMADPLEDPLDLILMDIYLEDSKNGMDFARELRISGDKTNIIFITNSNEFALDGYTIDSKAYILKPVKKDLLEEALLRTLKNQSGDRIVLQTPSKVLTLDLNRIYYIEIINKELIIHYDDFSTDTLRMTLKEVRDRLPEEQFIQTHRSYIASIPAIKSVKNRDIVLMNGEIIPVSRKHSSNLQQKLMKWYIQN